MAGNTLGLMADIGATNARFALSEGGEIRHIEVLKCDDYSGIVGAAKHYLEQIGVTDKPTVGAFSVAGPVRGDHFEMTNHPWSFSIESTKLHLNLRALEVMNDFKAMAMGVPHLKSKDVTQIGGGRAVSGEPIGIIGPGTGLGVGSLVWNGERYIPVSGEGGHVTMPAKTQREYDVFTVLRHKYRHVSAERVCSGKGLVNIYNALKTLDDCRDLPVLTPEEISEKALADRCPVCVEALDMMMDFLGIVAGNLALTLGAHGGIYIAGGIIMQLGDSFEKSRFRQSFLAKGRLENYLSDIPTFVINDPFTAFLGLQDDIARMSSAQE